ncbi:MAG: hypothetical protein RL711_1428, partial [Bacteroidota bacterium]
VSFDTSFAESIASDYIKMFVKSIGNLRSIAYSNLITEIQSFDKKADIAILAFNRDSVRHLQTSIFSKKENTDHLIIETIDRVQGLTVDFCILFIPIGAIVNALHPNRFNVATSRAKIATLIISDNSIHDCIAMNPLIKTYFEKFLQ